MDLVITQSAVNYKCADLVLQMSLHKQFFL